MAVSDPVADFLTRIRNGGSAQHRFVDIPWSKLKESLAQILKDQGFIESFLVKKDQNARGMIRVFLKYDEWRKPIIHRLKRISKPGLRKYVRHQEIPSYFGGLGLTILSTSKGVMGGYEARRQKVGGELLCVVW